MKYLISLLILISIFQIAITQNYECIKEDAIYYYTNNTFFKAISIDSVVTAGDSLVYYNYPTITDEYIYSWCWGRIGPSWIGRYITKKQDGVYIFYNRNNQPITIQTLSETNEYWTSYTFINGDYIRALVLDISEVEFLGLTDTVKKISFQAYNINGDSISYPINGKSILVSKNYGLVKTINFKYFPNNWGGHISIEHCSEYNLCGIKNAEIGKQNLTRERVYDYEVGDEIHNEEYLYASGSYYSKYGYYKNLYLQKEYSTNSDTVSYLAYYCGYTAESIPYVGTEYKYYEDTLIRNYFIGTDTIIDILPDELIINKEDTYYWEYKVTNCEYLEGTNRLKKTMVGGYYSIYPHDCIEFMESKDAVDEEYYIEGLGIYDSWLWPYSNSGGTEPVYFKKGDDEWGTPYTFNCNGYYTSIDKEREIENMITIAPNPMRDWANISIETDMDSKYLFTLFNSFGKVVRSVSFFGSNYKITREGLPNGIYFYVLNSSNGFKTSGKLIMQ